MPENNAISIDVRVGSAVRIRRIWRSPYAGRFGVVSAIEPSDPYGSYVIEFEDGLHFRYERQDLEPVVSTSAHFYQRAFGRLCRLIRLLVRRLEVGGSWF